MYTYIEYSPFDRFELGVTITRAFNNTNARFFYTEPVFKRM